MKFTRLSIYLFALVATFTLWSCGGSKEDKSQNSEEFGKAEESLKEQVQEVVNNLPSPSEIPYILQNTGADFNQSLINDKKKVDKYSTSKDKAALNLGIYTTDIGYLSSYEKTQDAIDYLNAAKRLADYLGVVGTFDMEVLQRFEKNIANKDSLARILDMAVHRTDNYLKDDSRNKLAALLLTGSFVEGLYISTGVIKTYPKDMLPDDARNLILTPLMKVVLEQERSVDELVNMLGTVEQTEPIISLMNDLTALQSNYKALNISEQIQNNKSSLVLSDKNLLEITRIVEKMRKSIVE
ncbi:MAG: hypothetical protein MUF39_08125 [Cyclobacteriaceae bacterium]|jgi:hypothetical protein|nr:hypothetical protein [Cyclobacteriaceae bacterium]